MSDDQKRTQDNDDAKANAEVEDAAEHADPNKPSEPPRDGSYAPIERRGPMEENEEGEVVGPGSQTYAGATGHKGR